LKAGFASTAFPIYWGGAAKRQGVGLLVHISDLEMPMLGQCHYQLSNRRWSNIGRHALRDRPMHAPREKVCE
jgi:hypothetical protein